jgi:hypothetical protein
MEDLLRFLAGIVALAASGGFGFLVCRKAGYARGSSTLMAIGLVIPLLNLGILIYFISTTWPIQAELAALCAKAGLGGADDARALMAAALRSQSRGDVSAAIAKYEEVMRGFPATEFAMDAEASLRSLRAKIG